MLIRTIDSLFILSCTLDGITLSPAVPFLRSLLENKNTTAAYRSLQTSNLTLNETLNIITKSIQKRSLNTCHVLGWKTISELLKNQYAQNDEYDEDTFLDIIKRSMELMKMELRRLPMEQKVEVIRTFCSIDLNSDGSLDMEELSKVTTELSKHEILQGKIEIHTFLKDLDGDGRVSLEEFLLGLGTQEYTHIPTEFDVSGILHATFLASILEQAKVLNAIQSSSLSQSSLQKNTSNRKTLITHVGSTLPIIPAAFSLRHHMPLQFNSPGIYGEELMFKTQKR